MKTNRNPKLRPQQERRIKNPYLLLLIFLLLLLTSYPYLTAWQGELLLTGILTAILLACIYSVSEKRSTFWLGIGLSIPAFVQRSSEFLTSDLMGVEIRPPFSDLYSLPLFIFIVAHILRDILNHKEVTGDTLRGAICLYLLLGVIWASLYTVIYDMDPNSFRGVETDTLGEEGVWRTLLFFSFVTLTTVGFGDIVPVHDSARSLALLESTSGVLFIAILISKLVSLHGGRNGIEKDADSP